jgi:hypothetical protein
MTYDGHFLIQSQFFRASVCFEPIALNDFVWIPSLLSAFATEPLMDINSLCLWSIACQPVLIPQIV